MATNFIDISGASVSAAEVVELLKLNPVGLQVYERRKSVTITKIEHNGEPPLVWTNARTGQVAVVPTRVVGLTISHHELWEFEVFPSYKDTPAPSFKFTHCGTGVSGVRHLRASGAIRSAYLELQRHLRQSPLSVQRLHPFVMATDFKESTDGNLLTGIYSHALQSVIIAHCKGALKDHPDLLKHAHDFVTLARRCFEIDDVVPQGKRVKVAPPGKRVKVVEEKD